MSCTTCGQDVPVVSTAEDADAVTCVRCGATFGWSSPARRRIRLDPPHRPADEGPREAGSGPEPPPLVADDDDWDEVIHPSIWQNESHGLPDGPLRTSWPTVAPRTADGRRHRSPWLQWTILTAGAALFSCGAALIAWSFGEDRHYLWNVGAPMALAGQAAFLIGLVLQLDVLWQYSKQASRRLDDLDQRVAPTRKAAATSVQPQADSRPFRNSHETRAPETLLNDLKGRLDQMATRLTRQES